VNHYDSSELNKLDARYEILYKTSPGATKFLGYYLLIEKKPELLDKYNYVVSLMMMLILG